LRINDTPHRVALAFSVGVFIAFFPVVGIHTIVALTVAWMGRLSIVVVLAGTLVNNPWTIAPIYGGSFWFGLILTGRSPPSFRIEPSQMSLTNFWEVLKPVLLPFCVGTIVAGTIAGVLAYWIVRPMIQAYQSSRTPRESSSP
jgi:uncharacterized protein (DUF2062 family)